MTVHRFFVSSGEVGGDRFAVPASIERQVRTVLRLRDGDRLVLLTGDGMEQRCRLDGGVCVVEERAAADGEPTHRLTVVQALLKGDGLEEVVQRGTEVGVAAFKLTLSERCIAREMSERKLERLRAVAREAAEQSERGTVPQIHSPLPLRDLVGRGVTLLFERNVDGDARRLGELPPPEAIAVGPEGGFAPNEVAAARQAGATIAWLGPRILRSSTVAPAAAAAILSRTGDFA